MRTGRITALLLAGLVAGCVQLPPPPGDAQAKKFEAVPGKSVVYIARMRVDSYQGRPLILDDRETITTFQGTYYRWETNPGTHRIAAIGPGGDGITFTTAPGQIYYLQHTVLEDRQDGVIVHAALRQVDELTGRNLVLRGELVR